MQSVAWDSQRPPWVTNWKCLGLVYSPDQVKRKILEVWVKRQARLVQINGLIISYWETIPKRYFTVWLEKRRAESRTRAHCSLPDPSSSAGIKWIERTRVSDGTPPPERHSICYEVGVLMKCRELLFSFPPFFHPSLLRHYKAGLQSASHEMDGRSQLNFTLPCSWLMCLVRTSLAVKPDFH